ncbi:TAXI family TRAP transporter solute-binding subunit [Paenalcaligenes sp. Me131]|uniref:TAXI family TRAP transporter solute-binding subunit n=1 Tax=Paenalcaligenes sp. Me131 TaxID=3392636 RepID=UPI003D293AFB
MVQRFSSGFLRFGFAIILSGITALSHAESLPTPATVVSIGAGGVGGVYYAVGGAMCRMLSRATLETPYICKVDATGGSVFNMNALKTGEIDFAMVQSDIANHAYVGDAQFAAVGPYEPLRAMFSLHPESVTIVARKELEATSFDDLQGKRVNIGHPGSVARAAVDQLLDAKGTDYEFFSRTTELRADELTESLCSGRIDAFILSVGHPSASVQDPAALCGAQVVPLTGEVVETLVDTYPYYAKVDIPGGIYSNNPANVPTYGVLSTVVTRADVDEQRVYDMTKAIFGGLDNFKRLHPSLEHLDKQRMTKDGLSMPLHPGALRYFREQGWVKN